VLRSFIGEPPENYEGCHNDGNSINNLLTNLRWDTHAGNEEDRKKHNTVPRGDAHSCVVVSDETVRKIKADLAKYTGKPYGMYVSIGKANGVSNKYVGGIHRGTNRAST
jgi:hypothetical protein